MPIYWILFYFIFYSDGSAEADLRKRSQHRKKTNNQPNPKQK